MLVSKNVTMFPRSEVVVQHHSHDPRSRILDIPNGYNIRDLGGIPLANGGKISNRRIVRGEAPVLLGKEGVTELVKYGVRHVIDLRSDGERASEGHGALQKFIDSGVITLHPVQLAPNAPWGIDPKKDNHYADMAGNYMKCLNDGGSALVPALAKALADIGDTPYAIYIHCAAGKDRTGIVTAAILLAMGADRTAILDDYVLTGELYHPVILKLGTREIYKSDLKYPNWQILSPKRDVLETAFARIDAQGGIEHWLLTHGVSDATLKDWQARLTVAPRQRLRIAS